jgi:hypothetical protein
VVHVFVGGEAAAQLKPYRAKPTGPLTVEEDMQNHTWDLSKDLVALVTDLSWCYAMRDLHTPERPLVKMNQQFVLVEGDTELLQHVGETSRDAQALLAQMLAKTNGPFPLTDIVFEVLK